MTTSRSERVTVPATDRLAEIREQALKDWEQYKATEERPLDFPSWLLAVVSQLQDALRDEIAMTEQSTETLKDLRENWSAMTHDQTPDGEPLIDNILYWLIEDLDTTSARAALAGVSPGSEETA